MGMLNFRDGKIVRKMTCSKTTVEIEGKTVRRCAKTS